LLLGLGKSAYIDIDLSEVYGKLNALTFRRTKKKDIYVISTPKRPVPLEHYLWAGKELHKIVDSSSRFLSEG
jgi:hypothetical protein